MENLIFLILDKHWNKNPALYSKLEPFFAYLEDKIPEDQFEVMLYAEKETNIWMHFRNTYNVTLNSFHPGSNKALWGMPMLIHLRKGFGGSYVVSSETEITADIIQSMKNQIILPIWPDVPIDTGPPKDPPPGPEKKEGSRNWMMWAGAAILGLFLITNKSRK